MNPWPTRRSLLTGALGASVLPLVASAASAVPLARHLVVVLSYGGWDTAYAVDPKPDRVGGAAGRLATFDGVDVWVDDARPSVEDFFARTRGATRLVRGVDVASVSHGVCLRAVLTGSHEREVPDIGTRVAAGVGADVPLPCLNMGSVGQPGPLASLVGRTGQSNQLAALLDPIAGLVTPHGALEPWEAAEVAELVSRRAQVVRGPAHVPERVADFVDTGWRAEAMKLRAAALGPVDRELSWEARADQAASALRRGLSRVVLLDAGLDFDTHRSNGPQGALHEELFARLGTVLDALEGRHDPGANDLLGDTVVLVVSEMSRSPVLNPSGGKDHWPVATYLLCGGPVRGGRVVGSTDPDGRALPIDLVTGSAGSTVLTPAAVLGAVMALFGLDNPYDTEALHALL